MSRQNNILIIEPVQVGLVVSTSTLKWATLGRSQVRSLGAGVKGFVSSWIDPNPFSCSAGTANDMCVPTPAT